MELSRRHLRDYLTRVPDFEDMVHEEKALDLVAEHDDRDEALWFLLHWPEPHRAARLLLSTPNPLNGDRYVLLARQIETWGERPDHRSYIAQLRRDHGRKYGFWSAVPKELIPGPEDKSVPELEPEDKGADVVGLKQAGPVQHDLW
jgi:hypothetical protein